MPTCELCGAETGPSFKTGYVQGVEMILCESCYKKHAKSGSDTSSKGSKSSKTGKKSKSKSKKYSKSSKSKSRSKTKSKGSSRKRGITEEDIVMNYGEKVRKAREKKGLTQKDVGKKINEKASVIHRIESEHMEPSISLAKKLGKELGIKLVGKESMDYKKENKDSEGDDVTLGDVADIKKS